MGVIKEEKLVIKLNKPEENNNYGLLNIIIKVMNNA